MYFLNRNQLINIKNLRDKIPMNIIMDAKKLANIQCEYQSKYCKKKSGNFKKKIFI